MPDVSGSTPFIYVSIGGVSIDPTQHFRGMELTVRGKEGVSWIELDLFDPTYEYLTDLLEQGPRYREIVVQFGYAQGPKSKRLKYNLMGVAMDLQKLGISIKISATSPGAVALQTAGKAEVFPAERYKSASAVARSLIERMGLKAIVEPSVEWDSDPELIFEPTKYTYYSFISSILLNKAISKSFPKENYDFFVNEDTATFATQSWLRENAIGGPRDYKTYIFQRDAKGEMISITPADPGIYLAAMGGAKNEIATYIAKSKDVLTPETPLDEVTREKDLGENRRVPKPPLLEDSFVRWYALPFQSRNEIDAWRRAKLNNLARLSLQATAEIIGDPQIPVGEGAIIKVMVPRSDGQLHGPSSGRWLVFDAIHRLTSNGRFTTTILLYRYGNVTGDEELVSDYKVVSSDPYIIGAGLRKEATPLE